MAGYAVQNIKSNDRGLVDLAELEKFVDEDVAGLMVTNPNTIGVFEENITKAADITARQRRAGLHGRREHERAGRHGATGRFRHRCDAPEPAQDLLDASRRRRSRSGSGSGEEDPRAVSADTAPATLGRGSLDVGLRPAAIDRPRARILWQLRRAGPRAGVYPGAWRRMACGARRSMRC